MITTIAKKMNAKSGPTCMGMDRVFILQQQHASCNRKGYPQPRIMSQPISKGDSGGPHSSCVWRATAAYRRLQALIKQDQAGRRYPVD